MVLELYSGNQKANYNNNNNHVNLNHNEKPLLPRHNNLLCPNEVTFCELSDEDDDGDGENSIGTASIVDVTINSGLTDAIKNRRRTISLTTAGGCGQTENLDDDSIISGTTTTKTKSSANNNSKIPDGGYGWVVVFASVMVSLIADGISFSFGLLYIEFLNYFNESTAKTSWIGSIFLSVPLLSGPVMSNLVDRYGCRRMTIIGGILSGTGFILAAFSTSVEMLYWTFGVIGGLGLGIGYVTAVVSIAFWFDKKRTFATGIGASGTGLGTFLYAPFTQWLIQVFGWRGCCLILAGTLFNICVFGALMRDPDWLIENKLESRSQSVATISNASECLDEIKKLIENGAPNETVLETLVTNYNTEANQQIYDPDNNIPERKYRSELFLPTYYVDTIEFHRDTIDGIKRGSRRSLRRKVNDILIPPKSTLLLSITSPDAQMRPNFIDNCNNESDKMSVPLKHKYLASMETLNASEKVSYYDELSRISTDDVDDDNYDNLNEWKLKEIAAANNLLTLSCHSLPGSLVTDFDRYSLKNDHRRSFRGNSLDAIYENSAYKNEMKNIKAIDQSVGNIRIDVPQFTKRITSQKNRKNRHSNNRSTAIGLQLRSANFFRDMRIHRNSFYYRGAILNTHRYRLRASSCPNIYRNSMTTLAKGDEEKWYDNFLDIIKSIFDFSLFLEPKFLYFNISTLLLFIWFIVPYFYLPEYLLKHNHNEEDASKIISAIGVFNTIGMIFLGWTGDQPWLNIHKTYAVCLVVCGLSCAAMPLVVNSFTMLMILGLIFGLTFASSFSFTPIILVRLVDLDDFTCAYGLVLLVQGVGNLVGPPISGILYEITGVWDTAFYAAGFFIALAGFFVSITGYLENREKLQREEEISKC